MKTSYHLAAESKLDLILHQAEAQIEAQLTTAIAADQRALTFAGLLVAAVAALIGAAATVGDHMLMVPLLALATALLIAASLALFSARPTPWRMPGLAPSNWIEDLEVEMSSLQSCKAATASMYDDFIGENEERIDAAGNWMRYSIGMTAGALAATLGWQLSRLL